VRKTDGDMHVVPANEQPQTRWYPETLDELLSIVTQPQLEEGPPVNVESHACGSH
jgi:hypothetical protein